jgi:hypothetical protein
MANGWTDTDLAVEAGCHQTSVGRFFAGAIDSPGLGRKLALALGHPVERYLQSKRRRAA